MHLDKTELLIEEFVADILENGTDNDMFASGYLQGHLDLILKSSQQAEHQFSEFLQRMEDSLQHAYGKNELSQADRILVVNCWIGLKSSFNTHIA
ncbi:MAG: YfcL family protein [Psychrobium sp.]|nr:YfcL family protein [Psychrobium sp.]